MHWLPLNLVCLINFPFVLAYLVYAGLLLLVLNTPLTM